MNFSRCLLCSSGLLMLFLAAQEATWPFFFWVGLGRPLGGGPPVFRRGRGEPEAKAVTALFAGADFVQWRMEDGGKERADVQDAAG